MFSSWYQLQRSRKCLVFVTVSCLPEHADRRKARDEVRTPPPPNPPGEGTEQKLFCKVENKIRIKAHLNYIYQRIFVNFMCFFFFYID